MADQPDLDTLAKQYMDLWQQNLSDMAADPALAKSMAQTLELMNAGGGAVAAMMQSLGEHAGKEGHGGGTVAKQAAGTEAAGAASGDLEQRVDELTRRIAVLEDRLAELERKPKRTGSRAKKSAAKRRS